LLLAHLGCLTVLWELLARKIPFAGLPTYQIPVAVVKGERPEIPKDCPPKYANLIQMCWQANHQKRPSFSQILEDLRKQAAEYHLYIE
jgi:hypothetical protein